MKEATSVKTHFLLPSVEFLFTFYNVIYKLYFMWYLIHKFLSKVRIYELAVLNYVAFSYSHYVQLDKYT